ncbi:MAG: ATP-binding protein [Pseudomonadota bacterium]
MHKTAHAAVLMSWASLVAEPAFAQSARQGVSTGWTAAFLVLLVAALALGIASLIARRQTEARAKLLENASQTLLALASKSPDAYLLVHGDGRLVVSDRLREWLDLPFAPRQLTDLGPGETGGGMQLDGFQRLFEAIKAALDGTTPRTQLKVLTQNGQRSLAANILCWEDKESRAVALCWMRDITEIEGVLAANQAGQGNLRSALHAARTLLERVPQPVWWRSSDTADLIDANAAYIKAVEAGNLDEIVDGQVELVGRGESEAQRGLALQAQTDGDMIGRDARVVVRGERRAYRLSEIPLGDGVIGGIAQDNTPAYELEEELGRFAESQNDILNMLSSAVAVFGPEQRLIFFNTAFAELAGLSAAWLSEKPHHSEVLERMRENQRLPEQANFPAWKQQQMSYYTGLIEPEVDTWHLPDDTTLRVVLQPHPFGGILQLFEDVTDKLALERSFNTLITVQRATLNNLREATAVFGGDGGLQLHNQVFEALWQLDGDTLARKPRISDLAETLADKFEERDDAQRLQSAVVQSTVARTPSNGQASLADGRVIDYTAVPLPDGAALLTCSDVTASVQIERALRDRATALQAADTMKSEFVTNMSYELRTPLTSILGFAEMLEAQVCGPLNERQNAYIADILSSSSRLRDLIDGILDLAVSDAGQLAMDLEDGDVADLLSHIIEAQSEASAAKNVTISANLEDSAGQLDMDRRRLSQAIGAVLDNAIRWAPEGGQVDVHAKGSAAEVEIHITDNGAGIPEEERAMVFERFQRGTNISGNKGAGLGLSLARQFVALHGGTIDISPAPETGTTVRITLPRNASEILAAE